MIAFAPGDTIHAAITLAGHANAPHRIAVTWSYLDDRQTVLAESKLLAVAGELVTTFRIGKPDGWPPGHYRVQVALDGQVVQTRLFEVR